MGPVNVVVLLPYRELPSEVDVVGVLEELVELELVGEMRAPTLPLRLGLLGLT